MFILDYTTKLMFKTINAEFGTRLTGMFIYVHIVYNLL